GRTGWVDPSNNGASGSSSSSSALRPPPQSSSKPISSVPTSKPEPGLPSMTTPEPVRQASMHAPEPEPMPQQAVTRVRALHKFEPTEPGELAFDKGDIIKVVDRGYKDWWRGQLRGKTGIFPVNYVVSIAFELRRFQFTEDLWLSQEPLPEPTPSDLA